MTTITDAFVLPRPEDIRAMGFVVRLRESEPGSDELKRLVDDYVVTPAVEKELPRILEDMRQIVDRGEEYGRFVHGSFGSGKSHFMTMLSLLIEGAQPAWAKFRPLLPKADHEVWLAKAGLLVVRIHMLSVRGKSTGFDRAVYDGFNAALKRRGKAPFEFLNVDSIFDEVRRDAKEYGDIVWKRLESEGIVGGRDDFEAIAAGSLQTRERFARAWLKYKGRDPSDAGVDPRWTDGLKRMAEHAKSQGFGGIVLMIDEFLLWLAEKSAQDFAQEVNNLIVIVDHTTGQRQLPVFAFVALQRNIQEFYPEMVEEAKIHEHIDHHAKRFEITKLQDVELRHIVRGRVLRPRDPAAVRKAVDSLAERHQKVLPALLAGGDIEYLRDVYPFHPALIEMLVDVTSLMQRERSALRLLYELLVLHYPNLPLGEFLPVGSAFAAIFPEAGVEASKKTELMQDIHHQYYLRLAPMIQKMAEEGSDFTPERRKALDQLIKTVLLGEVSPRLRQQGLSIERLVQLNSVDVEGETYRGQVRVAETDLLALCTRIPDLQIAGSGKTAIVRFVLGRVSLGEVLGRARSKVDNPAQHFKVFYGALKKALELEALKGFEEGGANEGDWELTWRRTRRRGRVKLGNVREMSQDDFEPPEGAFKVLIDYPWDEPGHTVDEDRMRAGNARKKKGTLYTVCWLPRHMTPTESGIVTELAAVRYLLSEAGQDDLLETHGAQDKSKLLNQASVRAHTLEGQLEDLLREVYVHHGEFHALMTGVDPGRPRETLLENLEHIATLLMDRQYPQHPLFLAEPKRQDLEELLKWMVEAGDTNVSVAYDENAGKVLKNIAQPLELVNLGQTKASLRLDSRYIKDVLQRADQDSLSWVPVAEHLRDAYGFQPQIIDLFLCFLCQRDHRALGEIDGEPVEVRIGMPLTARLRLQRGRLVGGAEWGRLRDLGDQLFKLRRPSAHRSLQGQDRFARELKEQGQAQRLTLMGLHERIVTLGGEKGARAQELALANQRLSPLAQTTTDSFKMLGDLLAAWPDDGGDPLRSLVQQAGSIRDALNDLDEHVRSLLESGKTNPSVGPEAVDHLAQLEALLAAKQAEQPLARERIRDWNNKARELSRRLVEQPPPVSGRSEALVPAPALQAHRRVVLVRERVEPGSKASVDAFVEKVRAAMARIETKSVTIALSEDSE